VVLGANGDLDRHGIALEAVGNLRAHAEEVRATRSILLTNAMRGTLYLLA
jgi:hypothetical protein